MPPMSHGGQDLRPDRQEMWEVVCSWGNWPGVVRSALSVDEWAECANYVATGRAEDGVCTRCNGEAGPTTGGAWPFEGPCDFQANLQVSMPGIDRGR